MKHGKLPYLLMSATLLASTALAQESGNKGLEIARKSEAQQSGFGDMQAELNMILRNRNNQESTRQLNMKILEREEGGDYSLVVFDSPPDVEGTALLTHSHPLEPDDQWLYLPALKRVKRIASNNQSGPFMGSEFTYEDMSPPELEKFDYKYLREEEYEGMSCHVIERVPKYENSGYTRQVAWIDQEKYLPRKVDYYDRKNDLQKTLTTTGYKEYEGGHWWPEKMHMVNHQTGKSTDLLWKNYEFNEGLNERDFDRNALKRAR